MSIEGQGHFLTLFFQVLYVLCFTRPRYQVSVYRTIGPLVYTNVTVMDFVWKMKVYEVPLTFTEHHLDILA